MTIKRVVLQTATSSGVRDAALTLRLQKLQDAVATLQGDLDLAVAAELLPSGWTVTQSDETQLVIQSCGFGILEARATCGTDSAERMIPISVEVIPTITVTPLIPTDWVYEESTSETPERIIASPSGSGAIWVYADNGGGYAETRSIGLEVDAGAFEWDGDEVEAIGLTPNTTPEYSGSLPGYLSVVGSYSVPSIGGQIRTRIIIPGYGEIYTRYDLTWQW